MKLNKDEFMLGFKFARAICGKRVRYVLACVAPTDFTRKVGDNLYDIYLTVNRGTPSYGNVYPIVPCVIHEAAHIYYSFHNGTCDTCKEKIPTNSPIRTLEDIVVNHLVLSGNFPGADLNACYEATGQSSVADKLFYGLSAFHTRGRFQVEKLIDLIAITEEDAEWIRNWWQKVIKCKNFCERKPLYDEFLEHFPAGVSETFLRDLGLDDMSISAVLEIDNAETSISSYHNCDEIKNDEEFKNMVGDIPSTIAQFNESLIDSQKYASAEVMEVQPGSPVIDRQLVNRIKRFIVNKSNYRKSAQRRLYHGRFDIHSLDQMPIASAIGNAKLWKARIKPTTFAAIGILMDSSDSMDCHFNKVKMVCDSLYEACKESGVIVIGALYTTYGDTFVKWSKSGMPAITHRGGTPATEALKAFDELMATITADRKYIVHVSDLEYYDIPKPTKVPFITVAVEKPKSYMIKPWNVSHYGLDKIELAIAQLLR